MDTIKRLAGLSVTEPVHPPAADDVKSLRAKYADADQEHLWTFYEDLDAASQIELYDQLQNIDPAHINEIVQEAKKCSQEDTGELLALPDDVCDTLIDAKAEDIAKWRDAGLKLIAGNEVAVIVMAGGQGTRLGSSEPKGCFNIGLPSAKSLFQLQAERIRKVEQLAYKEDADAVSIPWYIMTSGPTRTATEEFFNKHEHFGLRSDNVFFFDQGTLPCISNDNKIIMETKAKIAIAPDGNGGIYNALIVGGVLSDMEKRGIKHVHVYCVDNCLAKVADPVFIGWSAERDLDIATKVVRKRDPSESVGLVMLRNDKPDVVEYSEMSEELAKEKDSAGLLKYRAANIVQHYYSYRFLAAAPTWLRRLKHHIAKKKIPFTDIKTGQQEKPEKPNGIKLEQFVFDVFPFVPMERFGCLEVARQDEFSPLKNASGEDSAESSCKHMLEQGARWVKVAGGRSVDDGIEQDKQGVEVSPLVSYSGEGLERYVKDKEIRGLAFIEVNKK